MSVPPGDTKGDFCKATLHLNRLRSVLEDGVSRFTLQALDSTGIAQSG